MKKATQKIGWLVVARKEMRELWVGGRAAMLIVMFSVVLGILTFLLATNLELSLMKAEEMVMLVIKAVMALGLFMGLIIAADSISGEREKGSLESLLLTPVSRRSLIFGKFIAAFSPWSVAFLVAAPYMAILSPRTQFTLEALLITAIMGTIMVLMITAFGMLVSVRSKSNRVSITVSLITFLFILLPTQLPGPTQTGATGLFIKHLTPTESTIHFTEKVLVNNNTISEVGTFLISPIVLMLLALILLFLFEAPFLNFYGGRNWKKNPKNKTKSKIAVLFLFILLGAGLIIGSSPEALYAQSPPIVQAEKNNLYLSVDTNYVITKTGDLTTFTSTVTYDGAEPSLPLITALNLVNLKKGTPVDPEDWSPVRTQNIEPMSLGESVVQEWEVRSILDGDYLVYLSVIPAPQIAEKTSLPVASPAIHLTVNHYARLNPGGVLPLAIGMPVVLSMFFYGIYHLRRRKIY